ncbi:epidermal growth factor receptor kinase substrate 8-like protein 3 [Carassius auratus]|uniref:Epidermal growth factor receptor kinase substrate 8-like protein 3 n=1 Tax=Carassius auratus TaxID=7957 RepID=A0A6P6P2S6_CARAU|nr:epidermal growth factor receptor kinase substrate 8-like protein 3 [Carassius auratus]
MYGRNPVPVFQSRGFSSEPLSQGSGMSLHSAKSIYMQRKGYSESIGRQDHFQYRVEHLFTCVLDGREVSSTDDCVNRLKNMDSKGKVWGQDMMLQVHANQLQLCDIETMVLESVRLSIRAMRAVLDSCVFDSLLIISVQDFGQRASQAFLFQCEEIGAQEVENDLEKAMQQGGVTIPLLIEPQMDIRSHLERMIGWGYPGSMNRPAACSQTLLPQNSHFLCTATMKTMMVSQYPPNIPPTVLSPLLTGKALHLLGKCITPNEDVLWGSLGDAWSIPRSSIIQNMFFTD